MDDLAAAFLQCIAHLRKNAPNQQHLCDLMRIFLEYLQVREYIIIRVNELIFWLCCLPPVYSVMALSVASQVGQSRCAIQSRKRNRIKTPSYHEF